MKTKQANNFVEELTNINNLFLVIMKNDFVVTNYGCYRSITKICLEWVLVTKQVHIHTTILYLGLGIVWLLIYSCSSLIVRQKD